MDYTKFELKYLLVAPFTLLLMAWFAVGMKFRHNRLLVILIGYPFWVYDLVYNWTVGWFLFGKPEKPLVTDRLKRMQGTHHGIQRFIDVANEIDPGHV